MSNMRRPSDRWPSADDLDSDSEQFKLIQKLLSSADFEYLKTQAIKTREKCQPDEARSVSCSIELTRFGSGRNNIVFEIEFSDGVFWVARVSYRVTDPYTLDEYKMSALSELATMKFVRSQTTIPIPQVFDFEMSIEQPFGYPYIFMECMKGFSLEGRIVVSIPPPFHSKVAQQLANIWNQLQNLNFDRIGRLWCGESTNEPVSIIPMAWHRSPGPLDTSLEYFYEQQLGDNQGISHKYPEDLNKRTAGWVLMTALPHIVIADRIRGPFPLCHLDLHYGNLLFDDEYNITGLIDWSNAQTAPLEQQVVCPEIVTFPSLSDDDNRPVINFRNLIIEFLKELEEDNGLDRQHSPLSVFMASKRAEITFRCSTAGPQNSHVTGKLVAKLMYGNTISWEQLREVYSAIPLP